MKKTYSFIVLLVGLVLVICIWLCTRKDDARTSDAGDGLQERAQSTGAAGEGGRRSPTTESHVPSPEARESQPSRSEKLLSEIAGIGPSEAVRAIVGLVEGNDGRESRRAALKALTRDLTPEDVAALTVFLDMYAADVPGISPKSLAGMKNDIVDVLTRQEHVPDGLGNDLIRMFQDDGHDTVWRDYCLQYMTAYYDARWPAGERHEPSPEQAAIRETCWNVAKDKSEPFSGTALLGLYRLERDHKVVDPAQLRATAAQLAIDDHTCEPSRITAMRMSASMGNSEVLPSARVLAQTGETVPLRMAAIATVGDVGEGEDIELLHALSESTDKRVQKIAASALDRLRRRIAQE